MHPTTTDTKVGREKPIIFSGESVRAIMSGRKNQTRRVVKPQPGMEENGDIHFKWATFYANGLTYTWGSNGVGGENWQANDHPKEDKFAEALKRGPANKFVPYRVGDRLWVREGHRFYGRERNGMIEGGFEYRGGDARGFTDFSSKYPVQRMVATEFEIAYRMGKVNKWKPPIHMPRWASRLALEVTAMRVERLQEISEADCLAEGGWAYANLPIHKAPCRSFQEAWDTINGKKYPWSSNPWVWVIEFKPVTP